MTLVSIDKLIKAIESGEAKIDVLYKGKFYPLTQDELEKMGEQPEEVEDVQNPLCF